MTPSMFSVTAWASIRSGKMSDAWRAVASRKQEERTSRIPSAWRLTDEATTRRSVLDVPRQCGLLTNQELNITEAHDATALVEQIARGLLKSEDVVRAFCKRAAIAHQVTNCLTEILFDDAIVRAQYLDSYLERTGQPIGPLHGIPISLKDTFKIRGYDASVGVAALCHKPADANSALVDLLVSLGAVLYCKTNIPQTMMALDSHNNVFGRTINPANKDLTAGGSSGGEGALIAMRGSILGIGTDVGGSIRVPAMANGLYGVKPSHGRVPYGGQEGGMKPGSSKYGIESTAGPIATSIRDCELLLKAVANGSPEIFDADVIPQNWDQQTPLHKTGPLRIGIARTDGHVKPLPPIEKLLSEVAQTLHSSPHNIELVEIDLSALLPRALKTFNGITSIDGANAWFDLLAETNEPLSPWLQGRLTRRPKKSIDDVRALQHQKLDLQAAFLAVWRESGGHWLTDASEAHLGDRTLDALICPVAPHPVAPVDRWNTVNYTAAFNLLDVAAGVLPVRPFARKDLLGEVPDSAPLNGWDKINRELWTKVDREVYLDSPLSVQVVCPRLAERRLVEVMARVGEALRPLRGGGARSESKL